MAHRRNRRVGQYGSLYGGDARGSFNSRNSMIYGKPPRRWPKYLLVVVIVILIVSCIWQFACGGLPFLKSDDSAPAETETAGQEQQQDAQEDQQAVQAEASGTYQEGLNTTVTISAVGDCTLASDVNFDSDTSFENVYAANSPSYFLKRVKGYFEKDDITIVNCEGTFSSRGEREDKEFAFRAPEKYVKILSKASVEAANLANNHSYDYGADSFEDTKSTLKEANIASFGYEATKVYESNGIKVGLFGINALAGEDDARTMMVSDIAGLKQEGCALVIGVFHWGIEGNYDVDVSQVNLAHAAIDEGCDLVLGGHPHVLQGVEKYQDRYICYSLGNFCFGGNDDPMDYNTMIYQQKFTFENGELVVNDTTLSDVGIIPCMVSSSESVNNYQPMPLAGDRCTKLVKKLNKYSKMLAGESVKFETELNMDDVAPIVAPKTSAAPADDAAGSGTGQ